MGVTEGFPTLRLRQIAGMTVSMKAYFDTCSNIILNSSSPHVSDKKEIKNLNDIVYNMFMIALALKTVKQVRKMIIGIIGAAVLFAGIAMIVLPGPAVVVIPIGLGILATEFVWAKSLLSSVKQRIEKNRKKKGNPSQS